MAESIVIVQYGELMVEEADADSWVVHGSDGVGTFESLIEALLEFDHRVGTSGQPKSEIVWLSDRFELLSLLGDNGCNTFGADVDGGFVRIDGMWLPREFFDEYGGDIDEHLEVVASFDRTTKEITYYAYEDFYIVRTWRPEEPDTYSVELSLPKDDDDDEYWGDEWPKFARYIGLKNLAAKDWFLRPSKSKKICEISSWWEYGECEIAHMKVYSTGRRKNQSLLVVDRQRRRVIGVYKSLEEILDAMTIEDGARYCFESSSDLEWWDVNTTRPELEV